MLNKSGNIEQFDRNFKNSFEAVSPDVSWNIPSDKIWKNIDAALPIERKRKFAWWWFSFVLLFIVLTIGSALIFNDRTDAVVQFPNLSKDLGSPNENQKSQALATDRMDLEIQEDTEVISTQGIRQDNISRSSLIPLINDQNYNPASTPFIHLPVSEKPTTDNFDLAGSKFNIGGNKKISMEKLIPNKSVIEFSRNKILPSKIVSASNGDFDILPEKKEGSIFMFGGVNSFYGYMNDGYSNALEPFDFYQGAQAGINLGIEYSQEISEKISWYSGIQYSSFALSTGHNADFQFDPDEEILEDDLLLSKSNQTFATPYGTLNARVTLARSKASDAPADRDLNLDIQMNQKFKRILVPLGLQFQLFKTGNLNMKYFAGANLSYTFDDYTEINYVGINNVIFNDHQSIVENKLSQLQRFGIGVNTGLHFEYRIKPGIGINLNPSYSRDLNPIFNTDSFDTTAGSLRVNLGIKVFLKK